MKIMDLAKMTANWMEHEALLDLVEQCPDLFPDDEVPEHMVLPLQNHARSLVAAVAAHTLKEIKELRFMFEPGTAKRYILMGDVAHPGRVSVTARSLDEALEKANAGEFTVFDEQGDCLAFDWNGDEDSVETEDL